jgi:integrase
VASAPTGAQPLRRGAGAQAGARRALRWGYIGSNPALTAGRNRQPAPRTVRTYSREELDALGLEMPLAYATLPAFAAATGLRPEELFALERRDVDRRGRILTVARTISDGTIVELAKTDGSRRQVPLSRRALEALDAIPPRLDSPLVFPAPRGGPVNLDNWRRRVWAPAVEASGVARPARPYDMRATFISDALHAGVPVFTVAKVAGTSVRMIERTYGRLLDGAMADIAGRLDALDDRRDQATGHAEDV